MKTVNNYLVPETLREAVRNIAWESSDKMLVAEGLKPEGSPSHSRVARSYVTRKEWDALSAADLQIELVSGLLDGTPAVYRLPAGKLWSALKPGEKFVDLQNAR